MIIQGTLMADTNPSRKSTSLPCTQLTVADGNWDNVRDYPIRMIVLHTIVGTVKSADQVFNTPRSQRSTHYGIGLDGKIYQWVDEVNVAYQAGDYPINQYSVGIEHEDNGDYNGVRTPELYASSSKLVADIASFYHIPLDRNHIKKHSEVSDAPTACPDSLDIDNIIAGAIAITNPTPAPVSETMTVAVNDWKGLLVEAGSLEKIAPLFGFSQVDCKNDIDLGLKIADQVNQLKKQATASQISTPSVSSPTPPASSNTSASVSDPQTVKKNRILELIQLIFG